MSDHEMQRVQLLRAILGLEDEVTANDRVCFKMKKEIYAGFKVKVYTTLT